MYRSIGGNNKRNFHVSRAYEDIIIAIWYDFFSLQLSSLGSRQITRGDNGSPYIRENQRWWPLSTALFAKDFIKYTVARNFLARAVSLVQRKVYKTREFPRVTHGTQWNRKEVFLREDKRAENDVLFASRVKLLPKSVCRRTNTKCLDILKCHKDQVQPAEMTCWRKIGFAREWLKSSCSHRFERFSFDRKHFRATLCKENYGKRNTMDFDFISWFGREITIFRSKDVFVCSLFFFFFERI